MTFAITAHRLSLSRPSGWRRPSTPVLNAVDLAIPEGAVVGLVGRNGAGKSTLMRCLLGLTPATEGDSHLLGVPSADLTDAVRERLGYAAQTPDLFPRLNGWEHVEEVAAVYPRVDRDAALALAVQLDVPMGKRAGTMSLGDQQKLAMVLALAHDPDLLLLDEPVASLDPLSRRDVMRALFSLRHSEAPRTVLLSSHLLADLERVVSHVLFLRQGHVQLFCAWDDAMEHLRRVSCPLKPETGTPGHLHWSPAGGGQAVVDARAWPAAMPGGARALSMDELLEALNA